MEGKNPIVSPMDKHSVHIDEHSAVLADPDLRTDPNFSKIVMDHIEQHMNMLRTTDPALLQMRGEQALPPLQNNNNPPGGQPTGGPPQQGGNAPQGNVAPMMASPQGPAIAGNSVSGPGVNNINIPKPAQVSASLLPNPALQQAAMGNVKK